MTYIYITIEQAIEVHEKTVQASGGGSLGKLNIGQLESVLVQIQNEDYYPEISDKLTHLFFCANKSHCFVDGNKRIAITLAAQFLLLNGYMYCVSKFLYEMENISYHVAAGRIDKELLKEVIVAILENRLDDEESLKLKILNSIQDNQ